MGSELDDEERLISDPYGVTRSLMQSQYYSQLDRFESRYEEGEEYSFGEQVDPIYLASADFEWFTPETSHSLEEMAEGICKTQRKAINRRLWAIRGIIALKIVFLWCAWFPAWILLNKLRSRDIDIQENSVKICTELFEMTSVPNYDLKACTYFSYNRTSITIITHLWFMSANFACITALSSSWRPQARIFSRVAPPSEIVSCVYGSLICLFTIMDIALVSENFNWKLAVDPKILQVPRPIYFQNPQNKNVRQQQYLNYLFPFLIFTFLYIILGGLWIYLSWQLKRYGMDLEEFCPKRCGGSIKHARAKNIKSTISLLSKYLGISEPSSNETTEPTSHTASKPKRAAKKGKFNFVVSPKPLLGRSRQEDIDESYGVDAEMDDYTNHTPAHASREDSRLMEDMDQELEVTDDSEVETIYNTQLGNYGKKVRSSSYDEGETEDPNSHSPTRPQRGGNMSSVMDMMESLSSTMSALTKKIDSIESRVGDGSALLVMPPGENQWDSVKK